MRVSSKGLGDKGRIRVGDFEEQIDVSSRRGFKIFSEGEPVKLQGSSKEGAWGDKEGFHLIQWWQDRRKDKKIEKIEEEILEERNESLQEYRSFRWASKEQKHLRVVEGLKNILMVALIGSALYLTTQVEAFTSFSSYIQESSLNVDTAYTQSSELVEGVLPVGMMVTLLEEEGTVEQLGVQYQVEQGEIFFDSTFQLLKEALGNLGEAEKITQEEFLHTVTSPPSLFFELFGSIPLELLEKWLNSGSVQGNDGSAERLALALWEGELSFLYQEGDSFYACPVAVLEQSRLETVISQVAGEELLFAGQEEALSGLYPLVLLGGEPKETFSYVVSPAFEREGELDAFLALLDVQHSSHSQYTTDEAVVVRSGTDSLRFSKDGLILYQGEGNLRYTLPRSGASISLQQQVEGAQKFAYDLLQGLETVPELSLYSVEEREEGQVISFSYSFDGVPLVWNHEKVGAVFHLEGEAIRSFSLQYRHYVGSELAVPTLPLEQVQAVLLGAGVENGDVFFAYQDTGSDLVSAGWVLD